MRIEIKYSLLFKYTSKMYFLKKELFKIYYVKIALSLIKFVEGFYYDDIFLSKHKKSKKKKLKEIKKRF